MPPPREPLSARLLIKVLSKLESLPPSLSMPPPVVALFFEKVLWMRISVPKLTRPPPLKLPAAPSSTVRLNSARFAPESTYMARTSPTPSLLVSPLRVILLPPLMLSDP